MADGLMAGLMADSSGNRIVHSAYLANKIPCPSCDRGREANFYDGEAGLIQHFRIKHAGAFSREKHMVDAKKLMKFLHGQETLLYLQQISLERQNQENIYEKFKIKTPYEPCCQIEIMAKDPKECAKLAGMLLLHFGQLRAYGSGGKPQFIQVEKPGLSVSFNVWHSEKRVDGELISVIKTESVFVKRDLLVSSSHECHQVTIQEHDHEITGDKALDILRGIFKLKELRRKQRKVIDSISEGKNTFVVLPTGGGKTICYAVPALMHKKITVVIFPILALLFDQVERMRAQGINVCYLMSDMEDKEKETIIHKLYADPPEYNFLFLTPETIVSPSTFELLKTISSNNLLNFLVIDEAHCIDTWGFYFRPCYSELWKLKVLDCPMLVMTGTATQRTQDVILNNLRLRF